MQWCQECVLWKEGAEPGTTPTAAPGADLAPDEAYHVRFLRNVAHWLDDRWHTILIDTCLGR